MKKIIFYCLLILSSFGYGCDDDNDPKPNPDTNPLIGDWLNEQKDTITFEKWGTWNLCLYKNFEPYYIKHYKYGIAGDSIYLDDLASSFFPTWDYYYFQYYVDSIEIRNFREVEVSIYKRIKKK
jgi:hypothetical protein